MLEELPKQLVFRENVFYLQASTAPCGCWVVGYFSPHLNLIPRNYFAHQKSLDEAVAELQSTVDLAKLFE